MQMFGRGSPCGKAERVGPVVQWAGRMDWIQRSGTDDLSDQGSVRWDAVPLPKTVQSVHETGEGA